MNTGIYMEWYKEKDQMIAVEIETNREAINVNRIENSPSSENDVLILYPPEPFPPGAEGVPGEPPVDPLGGVPEGAAAVTVSTKIFHIR